MSKRKSSASSSQPSIASYFKKARVDESDTTTTSPEARIYDTSEEIEETVTVSNFLESDQEYLGDIVAQCNAVESDGNGLSEGLTNTLSEFECNSTDSNVTENTSSTQSAHTISGASSVSSPSTFTEDESDIGILLQKNDDLQNLTRNDKYRVLMKNPDINETSTVLTRSSDTTSNKPFKPSWLKKNSWLHYSRSLNGVFCRACVFFSPKKVGGQTLGQFVTTTFTNWDYFHQRVREHASTGYHRTSFIEMSDLLERYENPTQAINVIMDTQARKIMEDNKKVIESLLKVIMLCGKQGLALRGHCDDNIAWEDDSEDNKGNFIELVRFRAETDCVLAEHLKKSPRNARYTSKTIQNELVQVIGERISNDILDEVKRAKFYSIIADEVTDTANKEQLSLSLRYVIDGNIKEMFLDFIEVERITGENLASAIIKWLQDHELPLSNMRGQCYDGASNMSGAKSGCKTKISEKSPLALYFYCAAHRLNLAIVSACSNPAFRNTESYIGEIARFFNYSAKRQRILDKAIDLIETERNVKKLKDACRTQWVYRIDSYVVFLELLPAVHSALDAMINPSMHTNFGTNWSWDGETTTKATGFLFQLQSSTFLIAFKILLKVLYILRELTLKLQMHAIDVVYAYKEVNSLVSILKDMRTNSETEFKKIFCDTEKLAKELHGEHFELTVPRIARRQVHRSNPETSSPEEYYRITLYDEFVSHVVSELQDRFIDNPAHSIALGLMCLLPSKCTEVEIEENLPSELAKVVEFYDSDLPSVTMIQTEYEIWIKKWKERKNRGTVPTRLVDALRECSEFQCPNIKELLHIATTLPITSCDSERSFSQLKLIKTSHRSTMSNTRLSGLALMKINREHCNRLMTPDNLTELVQSFAKRHSRRLKLPFMLLD